MALIWNLKEVNNFEELYTKEDAEGYVQLIPKYETIIMHTMYVGINTITDKNWKQFYHRVNLWERIKGCSYYDNNRKPIYTTEEDVKRMIGLHTNASTISKSEFVKKLTYGFDI